MKMIPITQFIEIIKKQGAVGVLALWLAYTHFEVQVPALKNDTVAVLENKSRKLAKK